MFFCIVAFTAFDGWNSSKEKNFLNWGETSPDGVLSALNDDVLVSDRPEKATPTPSKTSELPAALPSTCKRFAEVPQQLPPHRSPWGVNRKRPPPFHGIA